MASLAEGLSSLIVPKSLIRPKPHDSANPHQPKKMYTVLVSSHAHPLNNREEDGRSLPPSADVRRT